MPSHLPDRDQDARSASVLDDEALDWFVRRQRAGTHADDAAFAEWVARSPAHQAAFDRHQQDWDALDALPTAGIDQLRAQLAHDLQAERRAALQAGLQPARQAGRQVGRQARPTPSRPSSFAPWRNWLAQGALAFMVVSACGGSYLAWDHWQRQPVFSHHFATARGQQVDVTLPDGSRLRLDTATRAEVTLYRTRREVRLPEGQAVFQVQKDASRPFDVLAGTVRVTVVGTRFSVRHTPGATGDGGVQVAVEEGRVRVARADLGSDTVARAASEVVELGAGDQVASDATGRIGAISQVAAAGIAPWRDGRISFLDTPLSVAIAEFERYGATGLVVIDPQVAALRLTGTFDPARTANFKLALPRVLPVQLRPHGDGFEIVRR